MVNVVELSAAAARERAVEDPVDEDFDSSVDAPGIAEVTTAFIVMWVNGEVHVTADLDAPITMDHYPTPDEILGAAGVLVADRTSERTAGLAAETTVAVITQKQAEAVAALQAARDKALGQQLLGKERS